MSNPISPALFLSALLLSACGSTGSEVTKAQAPVVPEVDYDDSAAESMAPEVVAEEDLWGPAPWTGSFNTTSVMLANTFRIEGPAGLLEHVVASSDDEYYERVVETTPDGLMQVIRRTSPDVPEIRVQLDAWTLAAFDRVSILERVGDSPVRVIASGEALWRDSDGRVARGERIECVGEIGNDDPAVPAGATAIPTMDTVDPLETSENTDGVEEPSEPVVEVPGTTDVPVEAPAEPNAAVVPEVVPGSEVPGSEAASGESPR